MPLTPKNRKEEWLQGLVDHETTLTPKNRPEEWMKEIIDASGGGGGGGGVLKVSVQDPTAENHILDKTWQEIYDAASGGKVVIFSMTIVVGPETDYVFDQLTVIYEVDDNGLLIYGVNFSNNGPFTCGSPNDYPELNQ